MAIGALANEKGVTLIVAVATLVILSLMGAVILSLVGTESYSAIHQAESLQTFGLAEAGAHRAVTYLSREDGACASITGAAQFTNVALDRGTFTVTGTLYNPAPITLTADIGATDTIIRVGSTAGFAPRGRIAIESELIDYTGLGPPCGGPPACFTGVRRGMEGTPASAHSAGASAAQYQCTIVSTGTISSGLGNAQRVVEVTIK